MAIYNNEQDPNNKMWEKEQQNIKLFPTALELMIPHHSHAEIQAEINPSCVVYTEAVVQKLMVDFAKLWAKQAYMQGMLDNLKSADNEAFKDIREISSNSYIEKIK